MKNKVLLKKIVVNSQEDAICLAYILSRSLIPSCVVALSGKIGVGKTYIVKNIIRHINERNILDFHSPTFNIINKYSSNPLIYHIDCYRINKNNRFVIEQVENIITNSTGMHFVEWYNRLNSLVKHADLNILFLDMFFIDNHIKNKNKRYIKVSVSLHMENAWINSFLTLLDNFF